MPTMPQATLAPPKAGAVFSDLPNSRLERIFSLQQVKSISSQPPFSRIIKMTNSETKEQLDCNSNGAGVANLESPELHAEDPKRLIPQLCNHFYHLGWASGKLAA